MWYKTVMSVFSTSSLRALLGAVGTFFVVLLSSSAWACLDQNVSDRSLLVRDAYDISQEEFENFDLLSISYPLKTDFRGGAQASLTKFLRSLSKQCRQHEGRLVFRVRTYGQERPIIHHFVSVPRERSQSFVHKIDRLSYQAKVSILTNPILEVKVTVKRGILQSWFGGSDKENDSFLMRIPAWDLFDPTKTERMRRAFCSGHAIRETLLDREDLETSPNLVDVLEDEIRDVTLSVRFGRLENSLPELGSFQPIELRSDRCSDQ